MSLIFTFIILGSPGCELLNENAGTTRFSFPYSASWHIFRILEFLHVVRDILEHLNAISTIGQTEDLNITEMMNVIDHAKSELEKLKTMEGTFQPDFNSAVTITQSGGNAPRLR